MSSGAAGTGTGEETMWSLDNLASARPHAPTGYCYPIAIMRSTACAARSMRVARSEALGEDGRSLVYTYDIHAERTGITKLLNDIAAAGLVLRDVQTRQSSLEDIFVDLVSERAA